MFSAALSPVGCAKIFDEAIMSVLSEISPGFKVTIKAEILIC